MAKKKRRSRSWKHTNQKCKVQEVMGKKSITDWAGLPRDILVTIFEKLPLIDCISIDSVCKQWRSVVSQLPCWKTCGFPWLLMSGQKDREMRTCISIIEDQVWEMELPDAYGSFIWGSFRDWLIIVKDLGSYSLEISLLNPFSSTKISLPMTWNFYHKMVLSGVPTDKNSICMLLHSEYRELAFWVQGSHSWHKFRLDGLPFEDAVFLNGSCFLLTNDYNICQVDVMSIYSTINGDGSQIKTRFLGVEMLETYSNIDKISKYLVECLGDVLLVRRFFSEKPDAVRETQSFEIYRLDVNDMSWKKIESLGDQMLFLGKGCSRTFSWNQLGVGMTNCIYFGNDDIAPWWNEWDSNHLKEISALFGLDNGGRKDWGIFNMGYNYGGEFCFRGNRENWAPVWFMAPPWWYRKSRFKRANIMTILVKGNIPVKVSD